ncbi:MAG TPA: hypothetical protein VEW03_12070 [Longimicrobiaceae bacterium]|nr:hypothetical protein [Longimicrobiaceae bacterium]
MRVACVGNMNNNSFTIARYLRDRGIEADLLLLDDELDHFHPSADTFDLDYQAWTTQLGWGSPGRFRATPPEGVTRDLAGYDFLLTSGGVPAYLSRAGRRSDLYVPWGGDLMYYPFPRLFKDPRAQVNWVAFSRAQRQGIRTARCICSDMANDDIARVFRSLRPAGARLRYGIPMVYTPLYNSQAIREHYDASHWHRQFARVRAEHDLVVFHHARHTWRLPETDFNWKANDRLLRGFAAFLRARPEVRACLVTMEYGPHVADSRALAAELGIAHAVRFFPRMARKDLMVGLSLCDVATGEFGMSWLSAGTVYEALAMARPLLHHRDDALYRGFFPELYPLMNARTDDEIAAALAGWADDPEAHRRMGEAGRRWLQRYAIDEPIDAFVRLMRGEEPQAAPRTESAA